jgi:hypothetical protein
VRRQPREAHGETEANFGSEASWLDWHQYLLRLAFLDARPVASLSDDAKVGD